VLQYVRHAPISLVPNSVTPQYFRRVLQLQRRHWHCQRSQQQLLLLQQQQTVRQPIGLPLREQKLIQSEMSPQSLHCMLNLQI
jgi:hypothetical protein